MSALVSDLADLFLPADCALCAAPGRRLCPVCRQELGRALAGPVRVEEPAPALPLTCVGSPLPVVAAGRYAPPLSTALLAFKDHDGLHLGAVLAPALLGAVRGALDDPDVRALWAAERLAVGSAGRGAPAPVLVPVPGSRSGRLRRGYDPLDRLLGQGRAWPAEVRPDVVRPERTAWTALLQPAAASHAGASAAQRRRRRRRWRQGRPLTPGTPVVLVDDVVTTGATLAALARHVRRAGGVPVAAAVLAGVAAPDSPSAEQAPGTDTVGCIT